MSNFLNAERQVRRAAHHEHLAACESEGRRRPAAQEIASGKEPKVARVEEPPGPASLAPLQRKVAPVTGAERWAAGEHDDVTALAALGLGGDETFMVSLEQRYIQQVPSLLWMGCTHIRTACSM